MTCASSVCPNTSNTDLLSLIALFLRRNRIARGFNLVSSARRVLRAWKVWDGGAVRIVLILGGFSDVNFIFTKYQPTAMEVSTYGFLVLGRAFTFWTFHLREELSQVKDGKDIR